MPLYETVFITRQEISLSDVEKFTAAFAKTLTDNGGAIVKVEQWGLRDLSYPIKKATKGYYTLLAIDSPYNAVKEMERKLSLSEDVVRFVTSRVNKISSNPSAPMMKGSSQEETVAVVANEDGEEI
ncbi:MAG: 30S ribosomal protein S6 [Rickettsiales bacterium]